MTWFSDTRGTGKRPNLDLESLNLFLQLSQEKAYSARNYGDMERLAERLKAENKPDSLTDAVIWRFKNLSGLC